MTRVNVVDPRILTRHHLLSEHREIKRIPNGLLTGRLSVKSVPTYRMGTGHILFFTTRMRWLKRRYKHVHAECLRRGYNVQWLWPDELVCEGDWRPKQVDIQCNMERLIERDSSYMAAGG